MTSFEDLQPGQLFIYIYTEEMESDAVIAILSNDTIVDILSAKNHELRSVPVSSEIIRRRYAFEKVLDIKLELNLDDYPELAI